MSCKNRKALQDVLSLLASLFVGSGWEGSGWEGSGWKDYCAKSLLSSPNCISRIFSLIPSNALASQGKRKIYDNYLVCLWNVSVVWNDVDCY